jgi:hypothetical protein
MQAFLHRERHLAIPANLPPLQPSLIQFIRGRPRTTHALGGLTLVHRQAEGGLARVLLCRDVSEMDSQQALLLHAYIALIQELGCPTADFSAFAPTWF